jgi:hypothetical protein
VPKRVQPVQHENYKGIEIRSHPWEVTSENKRTWTLRLGIMFQTGGYPATGFEYLHEKQFPNQREAHTAGFEWGRRIIDHWRLTCLIPRQKVSRRLAEAEAPTVRSSGRGPRKKTVWMGR